MIISIIAAVARNMVIGRNNDLPWRLPDDMKYFMQKTKGHPVIMGRKNYESIPEKFRPLPNRFNIVVTRQSNFEAPGCEIVNSLSRAIDLAATYNVEEIFLIGGSEIYREGISICDRMYLTEILKDFEGDVLFPAFDKSSWKEVSRKYHPTDERHATDFDFVVYEKVA